MVLERFRLTGRAALVAGGGRGIGAACAPVAPGAIETESLRSVLTDDFRKSMITLTHFAASATRAISPSPCCFWHPTRAAT
jgi:hypothetical protein